MRTWWPLLWLLPAMAGMSAIAWRIAGRDAAVVALLLAVLAAPGFQQFTPGRIDHHNVQLALTLLAVAATAWSDRKPFAAYASYFVEMYLALSILLPGIHEYHFFQIGTLINYLEHLRCLRA